MKTKPELTNNGWNTSIQLDLHMTLTSTGLPDANTTSSFVHLLQQSEMDNFQAILSKPWLQEQSEIPFQVYAQPSGKTVDLTHPKTRIFNLVFFYNNFTDHMQMTILNKNSKKPPPSASSQKLQNKKHQIAASNRTAHHPCNFLCHAIMQIPQSHPGRETTNQDPPPPQPPFLQRWKTSRAQQPSS